MSCSPNPNPRTSGPGLAGHLVLPHKPIHPLNVHDLIFFYNIIIIIIIFICAYTMDSHFQQNETDKTSLCGELLYLDRMALIFIPRGISKDRIYGVFI